MLQKPPPLVMSHIEQNILQQCHVRYLQTVENFLSKIFLDPNKGCQKKSLADFMHLEEFRRKLSTTHLSKICRKFSLVSFKMCRRFSVENIGVENFLLKMEKWPVENFLSKIVMFAQKSSQYVVILHIYLIDYLTILFNAFKVH